MNETREGEISIRLTYMICLLLLILSVFSAISYHLGKEQAYEEMEQLCIQNKNYQDSNPLLSHYSDEFASDYDDPGYTREDVEMILKQKGV